MTASTKPIRKARSTEEYCLRCWCCAIEISFPVSSVVSGKTHCVKCGAVLMVAWDEARKA